MTLVGAGYRHEIPGLFHGEDPVVDCCELIADRYFGDKGFGRPWELRRIADVPKIAHGLCGNAASVHGPDTEYLEQIRRLADAVDAIAYSDHLALTGVTGRALGHLAPNLFDDDLLAAAARNITTMVDSTGHRVRLENLATKTMITGSKYTPEEFYLRLLDESDEWDCLLDLTNIWINSRNRPLDPLRFIDAIPPHRIGYIHLAGGMLSHGEWIDSHSHAVHAEVFELLDHLLARTAPDVIIIERDGNWTGAEAERARRPDPGAPDRGQASASGHHPTHPVRGRGHTAAHRRRGERPLMTVTESAPNQREVPATPAGVIAMVREIGSAVAPHAARHDREASFVAEGYEAIRAHGYGTIAVPSELGGGGHGLATVCRAQVAVRSSLREHLAGDRHAPAQRARARLALASRGPRRGAHAAAHRARGPHPVLQRIRGSGEPGGDRRAGRGRPAGDRQQALLQRRARRGPGPDHGAGGRRHRPADLDRAGADLGPRDRDRPGLGRHGHAGFRQQSGVVLRGVRT